MKITLNNDIHNTTVTVGAEVWETQSDEKMASISMSALRHAERELCGMSDCTCGGWRGPGVDSDGKEYTIWPVEG